MAEEDRRLFQIRYCIACCTLVVFVTCAFADERDALKTLVDKAVKVAGVEKVQSVRAWTMTLKVTDRHEAIRSGTRRTWVELPDHYRSDFECKVFQDDLPIRTSDVVDGRKGWRKVINNTEEMSPDEVDSEKARMRLQPRWSRDVALLLDRKYHLVPMAETKIADRVAVGIELACEGEPPVRLHFDKETCRLLKTERS